MPSYEKNKSSGLWSARFREIDPATGLTHQKRLSGFKTKKEAQYGYEDYIKAKETKEAEIQPPALSKEQPSPGDMLFSDLVNRYLAYKQSRVKETTYYDTVKRLSHILPYFGDYRLKDITPAAILSWQNSLDGMAFNYKKGISAILSGVLSYGEKYHDTPNCYNKVDKLKNLEPKQEMQFWTPEEFAKFIEHVPDPEYNLYFRFLYICGCRRGEALALSWDDIDTKAGTVKISKSVAFGKFPNHDKSYKVTTPKNVGSNRTIAIPNHLSKSLKEHRAEQAKIAPQAAFVFGGTDPLPRTTIDRHMRNGAASAGLKRIRIHDLRHSCASYLIHQGVSIVAVSRRLGHTNIEQTLNTYSHMMPDDQAQILTALDKLK